MDKPDIGPAFALFEDNLRSPASALLLEDLVATHVLSAPTGRAHFFAGLRAEQRRGRWIALAIDYEAAPAFDTAMQAHPAPGQALARAWVFSRLRRLQGDALERWWQEALAPLDPQAREAGLLDLWPAWSETHHAAAAQRVLERIRAGDCYQVNLTFPLHGRSFGHPLALAAKLRTSQPVAHGVLIHDGGEWIISRSPELFVERQGDTLSCRPMKGTAKRHNDPAADRAAAEALLGSDKERAENLMIVDLIRNDLGRLVPPGGVRVERMFELEAYRSVYQLTSSIRATPCTLDTEDVLAALFPCGSVTGAPKIQAMQWIRELEDGPRGLYCGALGWLAPSGDFSLKVPIRTLRLGSEGQLRLDVGSGIVADSEAAAEYRECLVKAHFVDSLTPLQLIETLLWNGENFPLLAGHLERLTRSAESLDFALDAQAVRGALLDTAAHLGSNATRIRLLLERNGGHRIETFPLDPLPTVNAFALADMRLDERDPRLGFKTSARGFYDQALAEAGRRGLFDLLFRNRRGELCEGARSNLFVERGGRLLTPAAHCGLLPGVLRASLLTSGRAEEAVLHEEDLLTADRLWLGNALRGLVEVEFRP